MNTLAAALLIVFPAVLCAAALKDVISFTIPNWMSAVLLAVFPLAALACGVPAGAAAQHAAVGGVALLVGMVMFALNWMGGGDAKLLSASALWLGLGAMPEFLLATAVAGGFLALALLGARSAYQMLPVPAVPGWVQALLAPKGDVPYGVALAAGALYAAPHSALFQSVL